MGILICLRESGLVGMGAMFGGDVIQSRLSLVMCFFHHSSIKKQIRSSVQLLNSNNNNFLNCPPDPSTYTVHFKGQNADQKMILCHYMREFRIEYLASRSCLAIQLGFIDK